MPRTRPPLVTLTTDFGTADAFVASMKGVALGLAPDLRLVDVSHDIDPGDLHGAAQVVEEASRWFPPGTVHCVVVDPGVGTERLAVAVRAGGQLFVGPDNGVLRPVADRDPGAVWRVLRSPRLHLEEVSNTFHGRDVFMPAAVRLATGARFHRAGPVLDEPVVLDGYEATHRGGNLEGRVLRVDRFGNLITSLRERDLDGVFSGIPFSTLEIHVGGTRVDEVATTFGLARPGVPFAYMGSAARLELAVNGGSAAAALGARAGTEVTVRRRGGRR